MNQSTRYSALPLGRRIAVLGKGGKTTLSRAIAERFGLELIEQDSIRHQANWTELSNERHRDVLRARIAQAPQGWVSDGNYSETRDIVFAQVETVIVLALPWRLMFWRTFKRSLRRVVTREVLWNGNRESFRLLFSSRDSILYELYEQREHFRNFAAEIRAAAPAHVHLVILESARQLNDFYAEHGLAGR